MTTKRVLAFVTGGVWLLLTLPALVLAPLSVMASDSGVSPGVYTFIYACFALPVTTLLAAIGGFVSGVTGRMQFVIIASLGPVLALLVAIGAIIALQSSAAA